MENFENHNQSFLLQGDWRSMIEIPMLLECKAIEHQSIGEDLLNIDNQTNLYIKDHV